MISSEPSGKESWDKWCWIDPFLSSLQRHFFLRFYMLITALDYLYLSVEHVEGPVHTLQTLQTFFVQQCKIKQKNKKEASNYLL